MSGDWFSMNRLVDLVLVVTLLELAGLALYRRRTGKGPRIADIAANLAAGLCLMASLRIAIAGAALPWVALPLFFAGLAHALDLRARWRRR